VAHCFKCDKVKGASGRPLPNTKRVADSQHLLTGITVEVGRNITNMVGIAGRKDVHPVIGRTLLPPVPRPRVHPTSVTIGFLSIARLHVLLRSTETEKKANDSPRANYIPQPHHQGRNAPVPGDPTILLLLQLVCIQMTAISAPPMTAPLSC